MITVLENSLTRKKHTLNLVDHKGKVFGFNPYPNNKKITWELKIRNHATAAITDKDISIERYIVGAPFHFGSNIMFGVSGNGAGKSDGVMIELVADNLSTYNNLFIYGDGGEYYCEDIGLSEKEIKQLFSKEAIDRWKNGNWSKFYKEFYGKRNADGWDEMPISRKLDYLLNKVEKLEEKVNLLGNLK